MRHRADHGRHERPPRVPLRSYLLTAIVLCATVLSVAGLTGTFTARAAVAMADRGAEFAPASETMVNLDKAALIASQERARAQVHAAYLAAHTYTVRSGQSMSDVAVKRCGQARYWTGIYAASRARGWTAKNANVLNTGQHLWIACAYDARQLRFAPAPPPPPVRAVVAVATARTGHGYAAPVTYQAPAATYHGSGSMQQCIISRESGGNSQVMNSSAHYGLYQFSASTWAAHGGNPASFGHASVAEQNAVYYATVAANGYSDWSPYDGC
jgi:hypothetical protein